MLEVAKQQIELYPKSLDKLNGDSTDRLTDRLATTFVSNNMVSNNKDGVSLTATTSHFKRSKKSVSFMVELCTLEEGLTIQLRTESATNIAMASQAFSVKVLGKVKGTLKLKRRTYDNLTLEIVPKLCADIVLGHASLIKSHLQYLGEDEVSSAVTKLCAAKACKSCCTYCFSHNNCSVKVVSRNVPFRERFRLRTFFF